MSSGPNFTPVNRGYPGTISVRPSLFRIRLRAEGTDTGTGGRDFIGKGLDGVDLNLRGGGRFSDEIRNGLGQTGVNPSPSFERDKRGKRGTKEKERGDR